MISNLDTEGLSKIAFDYDLFYIDIWGVIHNGLELNFSAIETLKNNEYSFLDTGGIDFENSPGPASFKMGLNGETYKLIGQKFYI